MKGHSTKIMLLERSGAALKRISEAVDGGVENKYVFEGPCAEFGGTPNENFRTYSKDDYMSKVGELLPRIEENALMGELDHRDEYNVQMKTVSHLITGLRYDEPSKQVMIQIELLPTDEGKKAMVMADRGIPLHISSRASGYIDDDGNVELERIYTYDIVSVPGFKNARLKRLNEAYNIINENVGIYEWKDSNDKTMLKPESASIDVNKLHDSIMKQVSQSINSMRSVVVEVRKDFADLESIVKKGKLIPLNEGARKINEDTALTMARGYKVNITQSDIDELGKDVTREKFKEYFGIPDDADDNPDYKRDADFTPEKLKGLKSPTSTDTSTNEAADETDRQIGKITNNFNKFVAEANHMDVKTAAIMEYVEAVGNNQNKLMDYFSVMSDTMNKLVKSHNKLSDKAVVEAVKYLSGFKFVNKDKIYEAMPWDGEGENTESKYLDVNTAKDKLGAESAGKSDNDDDLYKIKDQMYVDVSGKGILYCVSDGGEPDCPVSKAIFKELRVHERKLLKADESMSHGDPKSVDDIQTWDDLSMYCGLAPHEEDEMMNAIESSGSNDELISWITNNVSDKNKQEKLIAYYTKHPLEVDESKKSVRIIIKESISDITAYLDKANGMKSEEDYDIDGNTITTTTAPLAKAIAIQLKKGGFACTLKDNMVIITEDVHKQISELRQEITKLKSRKINEDHDTDKGNAQELIDAEFEDRGIDKAYTDDEIAGLADILDEEGITDINNLASNDKVSDYIDSLVKKYGTGEESDESKIIPGIAVVIKEGKFKGKKAIVAGVIRNASKIVEGVQVSMGVGGRKINIPISNIKIDESITSDGKGYDASCISDLSSLSPEDKKLVDSTKDIRIGAHDMMYGYKGDELVWSAMITPDSDGKIFTINNISGNTIDESRIYEFIASNLTADQLVKGDTYNIDSQMGGSFDVKYNGRTASGKHEFENIHPGYTKDKWINPDSAMYHYSDDEIGQKIARVRSSNLQEATTADNDPVVAVGDSYSFHGIKVYVEKIKDKRLLLRACHDEPNKFSVHAADLVSNFQKEIKSGKMVKIDSFDLDSYPISPKDKEEEFVNSFESKDTPAYKLKESFKEKKVNGKPLKAILTEDQHSIFPSNIKECYEKIAEFTNKSTISTSNNTYSTKALSEKVDSRIATLNKQKSEAINSELVLEYPFLVLVSEDAKTLFSNLPETKKQRAKRAIIESNGRTSGSISQIIYNVAEKTNKLIEFEERLTSPQLKLWENASKDAQKKALALYDLRDIKDETSMEAFFESLDLRPRTVDAPDAAEGSQLKYKGRNNDDIADLGYNDSDIDRILGLESGE